MQPLRMEEYVFCSHFPLHGAEVLASFHERLSKSSRLYKNQGVLSVYLNLDQMNLHTCLRNQCDRYDM